MNKRYRKYKNNIIKKKDYHDHIKEISSYQHDRKAGIESTLELLNNGDLNYKLVDDYMNMHQLVNIVDKVRNKLNEEYQADLEVVQLIQYCSIGKLTATTFEDTVFVDRKLEKSVHSLFVLILVWAKYFDDKEKYGRFFNYLFSQLYTLCVEEDELVNIYDFQYIKEEAEHQEAIINVAVGCETFTLYFCVAHEIAHQYFAKKGMTFKKYQEEYQADYIAYDIVLKLLQDEKDSGIAMEDRELFDYSYLAPVMVIHLWDLIFYTDRVLNNAYITEDAKHPDLEKRRGHLFSIPYDDKYTFDTGEGNAVYNGFLNVIDSYKQQLLARKHTGKIDELIEYIKRR